MENSERDGNTRPPDLPLKKPDSKMRPILLHVFGICFPLLCCLGCLQDRKSTNKTNRCLGKCGCYWSFFLTPICFLIAYAAICALFFFVIMPSIGTLNSQCSEKGACDAGLSFLNYFYCEDLAGITCKK